MAETPGRFASIRSFRTLWIIVPVVLVPIAAYIYAHTRTQESYQRDRAARELHRTAVEVAARISHLRHLLDLNKEYLFDPCEAWQIQARRGEDEKHEEDERGKQGEEGEEGEEGKEGKEDKENARRRYDYLWRRTLASETIRQGRKAIGQKSSTSDSSCPHPDFSSTAADARAALRRLSSYRGLRIDFDPVGDPDRNVARAAIAPADDAHIELKYSPQLRFRDVPGGSIRWPLVATLPLESLLPEHRSDGLFETILLASRNGSVLAGIGTHTSVVELEGLFRSAGSGDPERAANGRDLVETLQKEFFSDQREPRDISDIWDQTRILRAAQHSVELGGRNYLLVSEPLEIRGVELESVGEIDGPLLIAGLVDHKGIAQEARRLPLHAISLLLIVLLVAVASAPLLKLWLSGVGQPSTRSDLFLVTVSVGLLVALVVLLPTDLLGLWSQRQAIDERAEQRQARLIARFAAERDAALDELERLTRDHGGHLHEEESWKQEPVPEPCPADDPGCTRYDLVFWLDDEGQQIGPELSNRRSQVPGRLSLGDREYFRRVRDGTAWTRPRGRDGQAAGRYFMERIRARQQGEILTAISARIETPGAPAIGVLVKDFLTFSTPSRDADFVTAVVGPDGRVLYHSTRRLALSENLLEEVSPARELRSLIAARRAGAVSLRYHGDGHRVRSDPIPGTDWTLLTLYDLSDLESRHFAVISIVMAHLLVYGILLTLGYVIIRLLAPASRWRWVWPRPDLASSYLRTTLALLLLFVFSLGVVARVPIANPEPDGSASWTAFVVVWGAVLFAGSLVYLSWSDRRRSGSWRHRVAAGACTASAASLVWGASEVTRSIGTDDFWIGLWPLLCGVLVLAVLAVVLPREPDGEVRSFSPSVSERASRGLLAVALGTSLVVLFSEASVQPPGVAASLAIGISVLVPALVLGPGGAWRPGGPPKPLRWAGLVALLGLTGAAVRHEVRMIAWLWLVAAWILYFVSSVVRPAGLAGSRDRSAQPAWEPRYVSAILALILIVAVLPALAIFADVSTLYEQRVRTRDADAVLARVELWEQRRKRSAERLRETAEVPDASRLVAGLTRVAAPDCDEVAPEPDRFFSAEIAWMIPPFDRESESIRGYTEPSAADGSSCVTPTRSLRRSDQEAGFWSLPWTAREWRPSFRFMAALGVVAGLLVVGPFLLVRQVVRRVFASDLPEARSVPRWVLSKEILSGRRWIVSGATPAVRQHLLADLRQQSSQGFHHVDLAEGDADEWRKLEDAVLDRNARVVTIEAPEHALARPAQRARLGRSLDGLLATNARLVLLCEIPPLDVLTATDVRPALALEAAPPTGLVHTRWMQRLASFERRDVDPGGREPSGTGAPRDAREETLAAELDWQLDLAPLRDRIGAARPGESISELQDRIEELARPLHQRLWSMCSRSEQRLLAQLARGDFVDPRQSRVLRALMRRGLVERDPAIRIASETLARFVSAQAEQHPSVALEEPTDDTWTHVRPWLGTVVAGGLVLVLLMGGEAVTAAIGLLSSLAASPPLLMRLLKNVREWNGSPV